MQSKIEYFDEKILREETKKNEKVQVEWRLPNRPVVDYGTLRDRMSKAIKTHNATFGKGNRQDLFKKILIPSNHMSAEEKLAEKKWAKKTDFICRRGRTHFISKNEYKKLFPKPTKVAKVLSEDEKFARKILLRAKFLARTKKGKKKKETKGCQRPQV